MLKHKARQRKPQCCECQRQIPAQEKKIEIELFRYSRHGVGVAHLGRLCQSCHGRLNVVMAAEA